MEIKSITSAQNASYKQAVKYQNQKEARKSAVFTAEGLRSVDEVLSSGWDIDSLWLEDGFCDQNPGYIRSLEGSAFPIYRVNRVLFKRLGDTENPQGILAIVHRKKWDVKELLQKKDPLFVVLEDLQDPGNVGTILRTADAAGAAAVFVSKGTSDLYNPKVVRSSMGSLLHLPVISFPTVEELAPVLQKKGVRLIAAHLKGEKTPWEADMTGPVAILIGNEGAGLSEKAAKTADILVKIPMPGQAESLNAAIASGMMLYESIRQRFLLDSSVNT